MKVRIQYFTDPLCAWSYASESTIQSLVSDYGGKIDIEFRSLPILDRISGAGKIGEKVHAPEEMQQEWSQIAKKTGLQIDTGLWQSDPPYSSWPANRAMKAAFRQGFDKGNLFTHKLRESIMQGRKNPSNLEILRDIAEDSGLDGEQFYTDMTEHASQLEQNVAEDRMAAMDRCLMHTPTLVMSNDDGDQVIISGTLDYEVITRSISFLSGDKVIGAEVEIAPSI